jgi:transposase-like protein
MNHHKNARLTFARREEMVRLMIESKLSAAAAAKTAGVSETTAHKWLARDRAGGPPRWPTPVPGLGPARERSPWPKRRRSRAGC